VNHVERTRIKARLASNNGSGAAFRKAKKNNPFGFSNVKRDYSIVPCPECMESVCASLGKYHDAMEDGSMPMHRHQPRGDTIRTIYNAPGRSLPLTPRDFVL